jgi:hypothetical protein
MPTIYSYEEKKRLNLTVDSSFQLEAVAGDIGAT